VLQRRHQRRWQPEPLDGQHCPKLGPHLLRWRRPITAQGSQGLAAGTRLDRAQCIDQAVDRLWRQAGERAEKRPLVRPWLKGRRVQEHGCATLPAATLKWKGDEVAERAFGQEVLRGEEAIVAGKIQLGPCCHRLAEQARAQRPGRGRRHRSDKEDPHVRAVARAGTLHRGGHPAGRAGVQVGQRVQRPGAAVEVAGQQLAGVSRKQGVQSDGRLARQVPSDDLIGQR